MSYVEWPLGDLPEDLKRPELKILSELGYQWDNPNQVVDLFEKKIAELSGSKYAVATDSCSNAIFLCLKYINKPQTIRIPKKTYVSVPQQIIHAGYQIEFTEKEWSGVYQLEPLNIWDGAGRYTKDMYVGNNNLHVLSFQIKKRLPIGRGGMILCNKTEEYLWFKKMVYDGRDMTIQYVNDKINLMGYHMYMTPEDAARGIILMNKIPQINKDSHNSENYVDLTSFDIF